LMWGRRVVLHLFLSTPSPSNFSFSRVYLFHTLLFYAFSSRFLRSPSALFTLPSRSFSLSFSLRAGCSPSACPLWTFVESLQRSISSIFALAAGSATLPERVRELGESGRVSHLILDLKTTSVIRSFNICVSRETYVRRRDILSYWSNSPTPSPHPPPRIFLSTAESKE